MDAAAYASALADELDAIVELTGRLVAIDSPTDAPEGVAAVCEVLGDGRARAGRLRGRRSSRSPAAGRCSTCTLRLGDGATVLLLGHSDTVWPVGTVATLAVPRRGRLAVRASASAT